MQYLGLAQRAGVSIFGRLEYGFRDGLCQNKMGTKK